MPTGLVGMLNGLNGGVSRGETSRYGVNEATANHTVAVTVASWGWGNLTDFTNVWGVSGLLCAHECVLVSHQRSIASLAVGLPPGRAGAGETA